MSRIAVVVLVGIVVSMGSVAEAACPSADCVCRPHAEAVAIGTIVEAADENDTVGRVRLELVTTEAPVALGDEIEAHTQHLAKGTEVLLVLSPEATASSSGPRWHVDWAGAKFDAVGVSCPDEVGGFRMSRAEVIEAALAPDCEERLARAGFVEPPCAGGPIVRCDAVGLTPLGFVGLFAIRRRRADRTG